MVNHRFFVDSRRAVHIELISAPFQTLCGWVFDPGGNSVGDGTYNFGKLFEPFIQVNASVVTCPECAEIIVLFKNVAIDPIKEEPFDEAALWEESERNAKDV